MGEAFITRRGGGGATIQRVTATDATSNTFTLTNPKRNNCLVFGRIYSAQSNYRSWDGILSSAFNRDHTLYGNKYSVNHNHTYSSESEEFTSELAMTITRNAGSITITLNSSYPFTYAYQTEWNPDTDITNLVLKRTNTIDIYVVDYD